MKFFKDSNGKILIKGNKVVEIQETPIETKTVALDMSEGDQVISPTSGSLMSEVTVQKPESLVAENVKKDEVIGGITGTFEGLPTETKSVALDMSSGDQVVNPTSGNTLSQVTIQKPASLVPENIKKDEIIGGVTGTYEGGSTPSETKSVALDMASGDQIITPSAGKLLSQVTVQKPNTLVAGNIKKDVNIGGITGDYEGGGIQPLAHTVTFMVNGVKKYIISVADGESINEPPAFSEEGKAWFGWWTTETMIGGTQINFPYTPTADITLYATLGTLAGMTWQIKLSAHMSQGYGKFSVNISLETLVNNYIPNLMYRIEIGYGIWNAADVRPYNDYIVFLNDSHFIQKNKTTGEEIEPYAMTKAGYEGDYGINSAPIRQPTFSFISGTDIANQSLVNWLVANATRTA